MNFPVQGTWLDIIKGSVLTLVLFISFVVLGVIPGIFTPLPALYYGLKNGRASGAVIVGISAAILAALGQVPLTALYLVLFGITSLVLPVLVTVGKGGARSMAYTVAINAAVLILVAAAYGLSQGVDVHRQVLKVIDYSITQMSGFFEKSGFTGDELQSMQHVLKQGGALIGRTYPALILVGLACVAGLNLLALKRFAARLPQLLPVGEFRQFRNPEPLIWPLIVAGFALLINSATVTDVALNVLIAILFLYFMEGLAVILYFFDRFAVPVFIRVIFYVLLTLQPYLAIAVAVVGIFDLWGNFRTPKHRENL